MQAFWDLPAGVLAAALIAGIVALALGSYALTRAVLAHGADDERRELAGSVIFRVSALHGLVLALIFAQEVVNLRDVSMASSREAALVGDIFYDLGRYDPVTTAAVQTRLASYTRHVLESEWGRLGTERSLHGPAWEDWDAAYAAILDLEPATPRQEALRGIMLENIREISMLRRVREDAARTGANPLFLTAAIVGVVLTSAAYFTFAPTALNLALLTVYASYTGLIIYFIVAFSNPYLPPGMATPVGFELLYQGEVRALDTAARP
jgi:hypothetical protein